MPWLETDTMQQRVQFIGAYSTKLYSMTELCQRFGISRTTGYKWIKRFESEGLIGLQECSRAPHHIPHQTTEEIIQLILELKKHRPTWGPKKLRHRLQSLYPTIVLPAFSTIGDILKRHGCVRQRNRRTPPKHPQYPIVKMDAPNRVWCIDFKGEFLLNHPKRQYCYPLTVTDGYSRYILCCKALPSTKQEGVIPIFERLFSAYGLPEAILSDNGVPFATTAIHGFSKLNIWWLKLGIRHEKIMPGHPEQNGRHERMHRTLKDETTTPPEKTFPMQQRSFLEFVWYFNHVRPHEGIDFQTPNDLYAPSDKRLPKALKEPEYPDYYEVRIVSDNGYIRLHNGSIFLSSTLAGETVGLYEKEDKIWSIYFYDFLLGRVHEEERTLII